MHLICQVTNYFRKQSFQISKAVLVLQIFHITYIQLRDIIVNIRYHHTTTQLNLTLLNPSLDSGMQIPPHPPTYHAHFTQIHKEPLRLLKLAATFSLLFKNFHYSTVLTMYVQQNMTQNQWWIIRLPSH